MEYIKGKVISQDQGKIIFESNDVGYNFLGSVDDACKQLFVHRIINTRTLESVDYAFDYQDKKVFFTDLLSTKGLGPTSAFKLMNQNSISAISEARKTGNIYKLDSKGIKPSILALIVKAENKNSEAEVILIKKSLENYGFSSHDITEAIKNHYDDSKKMDKNIITIIKAINNGKI